MTISALPGAGPLLDLSAAARSTSSIADRGPKSTSDTPQTAFTPDFTEANTATTTPLSTPSPATTTTQADIAGRLPIRQSTGFGAAGNTSAAPNANGSLFSEFKSYATASSQKSTAAYQEYVKAWGGRVVHGEVEFPPLSIYLE